MVNTQSSKKQPHSISEQIKNTKAKQCIELGLLPRRLIASTSTTNTLTGASVFFPIPIVIITISCFLGCN